MYEHLYYFKDPANNELAPSITFDQIPWGANQVAVLHGGGESVTELHNYSLKPNVSFEYHADPPTLKNHRLGSRMIHFGDLEFQEALAHKQPKSEKQFGTMESPTFTVSMIDPNWIYTNVPNSTLQTIDVQLMWGDTSENVTDIGPYPVQFTVIASS